MVSWLLRAPFVYFVCQPFIDAKQSTCKLTGTLTDWGSAGPSAKALRSPAEAQPLPDAAAMNLQAAQSPLIDRTPRMQDLPSVPHPRDQPVPSEALPESSQDIFGISQPIIWLPEVPQAQTFPPSCSSAPVTSVIGNACSLATAIASRFCTF